ncbi:MAG: hypothetical protein BGO78_05140 [Chloroflexi bacterium 44-23]|nr:MAG: hypothetical protein BGO78_05140 [Chloroflexi bacterium 44-23]
MTEMKSQLNLDDVHENVSWKVMATSFIAILAGIWVAAVLLPNWLPGITESIFGSDIKVFWYISRGSGVIAYLLLWFSMLLGLMMTNRMTRPWPGPAISNEFHQFISILGLAFVFIHAFILMGDQYIHYTLAQVIIPFTSVDYRPLWVGLGQIGFYLWIGVVGSFYVRKKIGNRTWRLLHYASFFLFAGSLLHGITSGTDSAELWMQVIYWFSGASTVFLVFYRVLMAAFGSKQKVAHTPAAGVKLQTPAK